MGRVIETVGVIGLGTMGAGVVEVFARAGLSVIGVEADEAAQQRGRAQIERSTGRAVERGRLGADEQRAMLDRIAFGTAVADAADADLVVEAVPERFELKHAVLSELDSKCRAESVIATNTSSLSVTALAAATGRPGRVIGMHFFNPAPVMKLVEVVTTVVTDAEVTEQVQALAARLGKTAVTVGDRAGFVANALLFGYLNRAVGLYDAGYVGREDLDAAMTLGCGLPMGPLTLLDLIGIDTGYEILQTMYAESGDRLHAPHPLLGQMRDAGLLGRKAGRGFYAYSVPSSGTVVDGAGNPPGEPADDAAGGPLSDWTVAVTGQEPIAGQLAEAAESAGLTVHRKLGSSESPRMVVCAAQERGELAALLSATEQDCPAGTVLGAVTPDGAVTAAASGLSRPQDVVGLHLVDSVPSGRLVEVVRSVSTAEDAVVTATAFVRRLGRRPVVCAERAGLVVDALLFPYLNDAARMLDIRYATADDVDAAMTLGCGYPTGPIALLDRIGLDTALHVEQRLYAESPEPGLAPAPLLRHLVTAGRLGLKTGHGFRRHAEP